MYGSQAGARLGFVRLGVDQFEKNCLAWEAQGCTFQIYGFDLDSIPGKSKIVVVKI